MLSCQPVFRITGYLSTVMDYAVFNHMMLNKAMFTVGLTISKKSELMSTDHLKESQYPWTAFLDLDFRWLMILAKDLGSKGEYG